MNKRSAIISILFMLAIEDYFNFATPIAKNEKPIASYKKTPEERRKLPIFLKINKKFIVTETPTTKQEYSAPTHTPFRKPLMRKFVISDKTSQDDYWYKVPVTRPTLMKPKKFFVDVVTSYPREQNIDENISSQEERSIENFSKEIEDLSESQSYEDESLDETIPERDEFSENKFSKSDEEFVTENVDAEDDPLHLSEGLISGKTIVDDLTADTDEKEFIFLDKANSISKRLEYQETNGSMISDELKSKRSVNVIEEENLGTTISEYTYTGKVSHSSSDLSFKNINL